MEALNHGFNFHNYFKDLLKEEYKENNKNINDWNMVIIVVLA